MNTKIFFESKAFAVIGASNNRSKFGNKVLRCYQQHHLTVYPVHPVAKDVEGLECFKQLQDLPNTVKSISIITPPSVTEEIVKQAINQKIKNIWMQPGAESQLAIDLCHQNNINVIANGPCILVELGFQE